MERRTLPGKNRSGPPRAVGSAELEILRRLIADDVSVTGGRLYPDDRPLHRLPGPSPTHGNDQAVLAQSRDRYGQPTSTAA